MARVLFVSKPVVPPWNDSGKNLVRDLALAMRDHTPTVLTRRAEPLIGGRALSRPLYPARAGGFAPGLADQARVFGALLSERQHDLWHFFFAPNPRSCVAGGVACRLRRRASLQTVSSAPLDPRAIVPRLFADLHVVLSAHTEARLLEAGLSEDRLVRIPPCVPTLRVPTHEERLAAREALGLPREAALVVFPGDLEFGEGASLCLDALRAVDDPGVCLVMACRTKTPAAASIEAELRARTQAQGLAERVLWMGETPSIHALLGAADVVTLPSVDLYAKMDYPLVLLEAMSLARPVVVAEGSAAAELAQGRAACAVVPHPEALAAAWVELLEDPAAAADLGRTASRCVATTYAPETVARAYEAQYTRLL